MHLKGIVCFAHCGRRSTGGSGDASRTSAAMASAVSSGGMYVLQTGRAKEDST